ncbi:RNase P subunit p30-like protein [Encephalitozoon romaleae SJ-2008]|uniref:RNase P subunit p30-like protein n=1 Tax=Encephalitozoon romaleae (strain SJ-2008) TaxID=1178016 RepID=I6ZUW5_ENCRO|nr:RNase P subunit p30-like protein [Encephalitozoon romaleae SJ-2008]AFN83536.1 RNase P subunit p30-like protein [Encephalitozoon romaleae SJ-2008]
MYYDVNISLDYLKQDMKELEENEYEGFCVNRIIKPRDLEKIRYEPVEFLGAKPCYSRVEVVFEEKEEVGYDAKKSMKYDLFVVRLNGVAGMDRLIRCQPDMITFNYGSQILPFKCGLVRTAIKENIFFEVPLRESLYGGTSSIMWMRNVRKLLFITNGKNVVFSSGARCSTEIKRPRDITKMLEMFGLKKKRASEVMLNSLRLLRRCAMKRYYYRGSITHSVDEGSLKRDFVLSLYRG